MIGVTCRFLYEYHVALLAYLLAGESVTTDPVPSWDHAESGVTSLVL